MENSKFSFNFSKGFYTIVCNDKTKQEALKDLQHVQSLLRSCLPNNHIQVDSFIMQSVDVILS